MFPGSYVYARPVPDTVLEGDGVEARFLAQSFLTHWAANVFVLFPSNEQAIVNDFGAPEDFTWL